MKFVKCKEICFKINEMHVSWNFRSIWACFDMFVPYLLKFCNGSRNMLVNSNERNRFFLFFLQCFIRKIKKNDFSCLYSYTCFWCHYRILKDNKRSFAERPERVASLRFPWHGFLLISLKHALKLKRTWFQCSLKFSAHLNEFEKWRPIRTSVGGVLAWVTWMA